MGNDQDGPGIGMAHTFKDADQVLEAPQVDARFRFVKDGQLGAPRQYGCDFNPLQLAPGKRGVYFPVYVIPGAETHFG